MQKTGGLVPLPDAPFVNEAGTIQNVLHNLPPGTFSIIECLPNTTRSKHRHLDGHWLYVVEGSMKYFERPEGSREDVKPIEVKQGELVWTPPGAEHKAYFERRTVLVSISTASRTHEEHEKRLTRVAWP